MSFLDTLRGLNELANELGNGTQKHTDSWIRNFMSFISEKHNKKSEIRLQQRKLRNEKRLQWFKKFWNEHILNSETIVVIIDE